MERDWDFDSDHIGQWINAMQNRAIDGAVFCVLLLGRKPQIDFKLHPLALMNVDSK